MEPEQCERLRKRPEAEGRRGWARLARLARQRVPVLAWARQYSALAALGDAVAGLTLGLTLVPQSIAYAALADLPVHYGLYTAFVGQCLFYINNVTWSRGNVSAAQQLLPYSI